jgi:CHRD domain
MRTSLVLTIACTLSLTAQAPETYKVRLSPVPVEAKTRESIAGIGSASATLVGSKLSIAGSFEGLRSPALDAKIHQGPVTGVRGPAILDLTIAHAASGAVSASIDLTPQQIESLKKGRLYIQIDSEKAQDGNLWGWLLR